MHKAIWKIVYSRQNVHRLKIFRRQFTKPTS